MPTTGIFRNFFSNPGPVLAVPLGQLSLSPRVRRQAVRRLYSEDMQHGAVYTAWKSSTLFSELLLEIN